MTPDLFYNSVHNQTMFSMTPDLFYNSVKLKCQRNAVKEQYNYFTILYESVQICTQKIVLYVTFQTTCENSNFNVSLADPIGAKPIFVKITNLLLQRTLYCRPKYCL